MDAIGYIRVTTRKQKEDGDSLDAQRALLEAVAAAAGDKLIDIIPDPGRSGSSLRRKGLQSALARMNAGEALALWVTKVDRLTRRRADLEWLLDRHFGPNAPHVLKLAKEPHDAKTPIGQLTLSIMVALAQYEIDVDVERTEVVLEHRRATGRSAGPTPLGYARVPRPHPKPCECKPCLEADDAPLLIDVDEQATLSRIRELAAGGAGPSAIARQLTADNIPTKRGGKWRACTVVKLAARAGVQSKDS